MRVQKGDARTLRVASLVLKESSFAGQAVRLPPALADQRAPRDCSWWAAPVISVPRATQEASRRDRRKSRRKRFLGSRLGQARYLRGTPVAVLIGDGLDAATPRYSDVAVEKAEVNANHRHPAA